MNLVTSYKESKLKSIKWKTNVPNDRKLVLPIVYKAKEQNRVFYNQY
jgi:hypothetical protein